MGISNENRPTSATVANASSAGSSLSLDSSPKPTAATHGMASAHHRLAGRQARNVKPSTAPKGARPRARVAAVIGRAP